ncbi:Lhr-like helicase [Alkalihalobacillus xiaoxiensis]|uniref:Lhr-like helicase n=1 Tax=Shouchella xiaoxiensis TaxID=766895 RepID=A0ABS2T151_9BACI|nr:hypothetical protein [Shouchella xiaoxiensis]MBM7840444.1 Lhr-like helicase [Shouchella xiaoxiensis]
MNHLFTSITEELIRKLEQQLPAGDDDRDLYLTAVEELVLNREKAMIALKVCNDTEKEQLLQKEMYLKTMLNEKFNHIKKDLKNLSTKKQGRNKYLNNQTLSTQNGVFLDRQSK